MYTNESIKTQKQILKKMVHFGQFFKVNDGRNSGILVVNGCVSGV